MTLRLNLVIGRFSPLHEGHKDLLRAASQNADILLVLVGSANKSRSVRTPWTYEERAQAIRAWADLPSNQDKIGSKLVHVPLNDYKYNDTVWVKQVQKIVQNALGDSDVQITLYGHTKEDTDYLKWFPEWKLQLIKTQHDISATKVRETLFRANSSFIPETVREDYAYFKREEELFKNYPFPETLNFNCADSLVECGGHILLVKRKRTPGRDTWALPGGFKNRNETFLDCSLRELLEETNLRVPEKVLRGSIVRKELFDSPTRDSGIPRNTLVVHYRIDTNQDGSLPRVSPADDALEVIWVKIAEIGSAYKMFSDHGDIISKMIGED